MSNHFLNLMDEVKRRSLRMASAVELMVQEACECFRRIDHNLAGRIISKDEDIDSEEVAVEAEVLRLMTLFQPMGSDMRQLCTTLKVNSDLERIADCAVNIAERVQHIDPDMMNASDLELQRIEPIVLGMLHDVIRAYGANDEQIARGVLTEDDIIDAFYCQFIQQVTNKAVNAPEILSTYLDVLSVAKNLERMADHTTNIAEDVVYCVTGKIIRHGEAKMTT